MALVVGSLVALAIILMAALLVVQKVGTPKTVGNLAPNIRGEVAWAGTVADFDLHQLLAQHAVVLYFFPQAFTAG